MGCESEPTTARSTNPLHVDSSSGLDIFSNYGEKPNTRKNQCTVRNLQPYPALAHIHSHPWPRARYVHGSAVLRKYTI